MLLVLNQRVEAHAFLDHADPRVGAVVHTSPAQVQLWFSEELEPAFSSVQVVDASGKRVDKSDQRIDASNRTLMRVSVSPLPPGVYKVSWRVVSVDTHVTEGDFTFTVSP